MIVQGGKTKKVKKPKKKKGNNGDNLAKETLKVAIANGTIKDLLWGEVIVTNQTESDESEEDMEDHSVEVFNELLLRKSSMVHHPKHRQSVISNHSTSTLPSMPESAFESTPPPLHMKSSMVDPSPRLKQTKVIQNIPTSHMPGKQSQHPDTIEPHTSTSHSSGHQHKRRYSAEESRDYREVLTSSLDVKHRSRAFVDIMRTLKVATLEARRASSYVHSNTRDYGVDEGSDEEFLTAEELSVVQDNDVLWGGVAGSRKYRHTLTPGAARHTPASGPDAVMMAELVHLSHSMRREREGVDPTGGTNSDGSSVVESTHGSRRGSVGSRRGSRGDTAEGSERYLHYTGSNERLDRLKLKYDDKVELNHEAQIDAKYSAHMHATLELKSSTAQHSVLNTSAHGVYERFTAPIPIPENSVIDREPGDVIDSDVDARKHTEEVTEWSHEDAHTHEHATEHHGSPVLCATDDTVLESASSPIIDTVPSPPRTPALTTTLSADEDYISRIRRAYQNTDISDSDSSDSEASAHSDDSAGARGTDLALSLPFGAESDTDSVSICLQSPTGTSSSVVEDVLTPRREKASNKRTPKQRRVKKLNATSTNNTTSANATNIVSDTTITGTTNMNTTNITNSPSPRTSVRKSMTARLSRPSKYIPKVPAVPSSLLPAAPASTPPVPSSRDSVSATTSVQHSSIVFVADESVGVEVTLHNTTPVVLDPPITAPDSTHTSPHTETLVLPTVPVSRSPKVARKHASPAATRKKPSSPLSIPTTLTSLSAQHTTLPPTQHTIVSTQQTIHTPLQTSLPTTPLIPVPPLIPHSNMNTTSVTTTPLTSPQHFRTKALPPPRAAVHASPVVRSRSFRTEVLSHNTHTHTAVYDTNNTVSHNTTHTTTAPVDTVNRVNMLCSTEMSDSWDEVNDAHERFLQPDISADITPNRSSSGSAKHSHVSPVHSIVDNTTQYSSGVNSHKHSGVDSIVHSSTSSKTTINTTSPTLLSTVYNEEYDAEYSDGFVIGGDSVGSSKFNSTSGTYSDKYNSGSMKYHSPLVSPSHSPHNMHYATHKQRDTITITDTTLDSVAAALENTHFYPIEHTTHTEYTPVVPEHTQYIIPHMSPTTHPTTQSPHTVHTTPSHSTQSPHTIPTAHTTQPVHTNTNGTDNTENTNSSLPTGLEHLTGIWPYDSSLAAYEYVLHLYHTRQAAQQQRRQEHVRGVRERRRVKQARQAYPVRQARSDTYQVLTFDPEHLNLVLTTHASNTTAPLHTVDIPISTTFITENSSGVTLRTTAHSVPRGYLASYSVSQWCSMQTEINSALAAFELSRFKLQGREVDAVVVEDGVVHGEGHGSVSSGVDNVIHHNTHNQDSVHNTSTYTNTSNNSNTTSSIPTHRRQATLHFDDDAVDNGVFLTSISPTTFATYSGADGEVTMEQMRHYAEQGYASFVQLLQARVHVESQHTEDIQPSSHRPVCIPAVFARSSGPIRPLLLSQRYTTHTNTDHAHTTNTVHNTTVQHSQPSRFLSLIKDAVTACKEAQAEQRRLAALHKQNTTESMRSPSTPLLYTTHISDETKRNFRYYDPHSSGIIYSNDGYTAEGSVVSGGSVQFAIEGHVCSGVGASSTSGGVWSTPTVPRIPKQHTTRTRNRNTVGSNSIVNESNIVTSVASTHHTTNASINTVIVPTASTESMLKYTNNNTNNNNNNNDYHTSTEGVDVVEQLLQMVLLVESRRDMQVYFAKTFLQLDMVVDVLASLSEAAVAVRENASLYGWILLNYADLLETGLQQALYMLRSDNASIVFDDESIHADTIGGGACEVVVYNASEATDMDIAILQQGGVTYIMNEPYSLTTLKAIVQARGLHSNQHESPELT